MKERSGRRVNAHSLAPDNAEITNHMGNSTVPCFQHKPPIERIKFFVWCAMSGFFEIALIFVHVSSREVVEVK